jgi:hypothetical protein
VAAPETLSPRALNRATLARPMLLAREGAPVVEAVERLGGLQAQEARPAFVALWTRLEGFRRDELAAALRDRRLVRGMLMRATLHLVSAADYAVFRPALAPVMAAAAAGALRGRDDGLDIAAVLAVARRLVDERPLTFGELRPLLAEAFPDVDERALGYATRTHLPMVMVPTEDPWAFPADAAFTPAGTWLGAEVPGAGGDPEALVRRHLAAFGPATAADVQRWSGLTGLKAVLQGMADELSVFRDERRRTLFDLADAPRPAEDTRAPARLLGEFDSLLLAHADRTRVVPDEHRGALVSRNLRVPAIFLVDGFMAGTWRVDRTKKSATLTLTPLTKLTKRDTTELTAEARALLEFTEPPGTDLSVEVTSR